MRKERNFNQLREISFEKNINLHAEGSCLVKFGNTHVICTASIDEKTPHWLKNSGKGWVTAEYGMLPRSTNTRMDREAAKGRQSGRTQEIQRLIGADWLVYQDLEDLIAASREGNPEIDQFDCSVFNGEYITGDINDGYLEQLEAARNDSAKKQKVTQLAVNSESIDLHNAN